MWLGIWMTRARTSALAALTILVGVALTQTTGAHPGAAAATGSPRCYPKGSVTLRSTERIRVYEDRDETKVGCVLATGRRTDLDFRPYLVAYPVPAISIAGHVVAFALEGQADPNMRDDDTHVFVRDLRTGEPPPEFTSEGAPFAVSHPRKYDGQVGSVKLKRNGAVAWIACRTRINPDYGDPRPGCVRAGAFDEVHKLDAGEDDPELLDKGRLIDPRSLRRRGSRITWTNHGRRRSATLR
jgi:hypothetical protein